MTLQTESAKSLIQYLMGSSLYLRSSALFSFHGEADVRAALVGLLLSLSIQK